MTKVGRSTSNVYAAKFIQQKTEYIRASSLESAGIKAKEMVAQKGGMKQLTLLSVMIQPEEDITNV